MYETTSVSHKTIFSTAVTYTDKLQNEKSTEFITLKIDVEKTLNRTYQEVAGFVMALVKKFRKGSVIVDFDLIFDTKTAGKDTAVIQRRVEQTYKQATVDKLLGNYTVTENLKILKIEAQASTSSQSSSRIATWAIVLIASCVVFILLLMLLISQWVCTRVFYLLFNN